MTEEEELKNCEEYFSKAYENIKCPLVCHPEFNGTVTLYNEDGSGYEWIFKKREEFKELE